MSNIWMSKEQTRRYFRQKEAMWKMSLHWTMKNPRTVESHRNITSTVKRTKMKKGRKLQILRWWLFGYWWWKCREVDWCPFRGRTWQDLKWIRYGLGGENCGAKMLTAYLSTVTSGFPVLLKWVVVKGSGSCWDCTERGVRVDHKRSGNKDNRLWRYCINVP